MAGTFVNSEEPGVRGGSLPGNLSGLQKNGEQKPLRKATENSDRARLGKNSSGGAKKEIRQKGQERTRTEKQSWEIRRSVHIDGSMWGWGGGLRKRGRRPCRDGRKRR